MIISASSWDFGTYHIGDQRRLTRAYAFAQSRQRLHVRTWSMKKDEGSDQNQTSSPTGWLHMRVWRRCLWRTKSAIISRAGSFLEFECTCTSVRHLWKKNPFWIPYLSVRLWRIYLADTNLFKMFVKSIALSYFDNISPNIYSVKEVMDQGIQVMDQGIQVMDQGIQVMDQGIQNAVDFLFMNDVQTLGLPTKLQFCQYALNSLAHLAHAHYENPDMQASNRHTFTHACVCLYMYAHTCTCTRAWKEKIRCRTVVSPSLFIDNHACVTGEEKYLRSWPGRG